MGQFVIAAFRPRPGMDDELLEVIKDHMPVLRGEGLITDRPAHVMKAGDGTIIEVFEWKSAEAVKAAHENPNVRALWARFEEVSHYVSPSAAAGMDDLFPNFEPVAL